MILLWLLFIFITCSATSLILCYVAKTLFPRFRSGEHKPGTHRPDLPALGRSDQPIAGREIKTTELPLVGGPAFTLAIICTGIGAGYFLKFDSERWTVLLISLGAIFGYMVVGFFDDWHKVYRNEGIAERTKFTGVFLVSVLAALCYFFLLPAGREAYGPYKDLPLIGNLICSSPSTTDGICPVTFPHFTYFGWLIFLLLLTGCIGSLTSLSVDFSDGFDGLAGGLVFSSALAFGIVITGIINPKHPEGIVLEVLSLLCAGAILGYLPWNWPSSWAARRGTAKRRAKIIMGDSGALSLGGALAMIAIFSRNEWSLLLIGGAFVLEGLSALIQARILTRFFRRKLQVMRFANSKERVAYTEFPLPFLATPLHHHFDLLGWDRRRLVYGAWALGAGFAVLGVMAGLSPQTWERYLGRILALILMVIIWYSGSWTKCYFVGTHPIERTRRRRLALYYGYPYILMGIKLCHLVEIIEASEDVIETPTEAEALWQRTNIYDARAMLGLYCYRAGYFPAALAQWNRIPERNRLLRPEIAHLLNEVDTRLALEKQETQPMRRDQLIPKEPILTGNLPPADLPNPYEPIRSEEKEGGRIVETWNDRNDRSDLNLDNDDGDGEEHRPTSPLRSEIVTVPELNGRSNGKHRAEHTQETREPGSITTPQAQRTNWFSRFFHIATNK